MSKSGVSVVLDKTAALGKAVRALTRSAVLVGVPEDKGPRKDGEMNNATLAHIHNFGSPLANIPARPFLAPGIKSAQEGIVAGLKEAGKAALDGNAGGVHRGLNKAGLQGQNGVRAQFADNDWPALKPETIARKGKGKDKPLIDTGQLRKSITYVVREK